MTFRTQTTALLIAFASVSSPVRAASLCIPPKVSVESPYQYILSLTESLVSAKSALDRVVPASPGANADGFDMLRGLKLGKSDFECAMAHVAPYGMSNREAIKGSATGATSAFGGLAMLNERAVREYAATLNGLADGTAKPGTVVEQQADLAVAYDEAWHLLITAVIAGTYAVVEEDSGTGLMSRLALTATERDVILHKLVAVFGPEVKRGIQGQQTLLATAAAALHQVVGDPKRKARPRE